MFIAALAVALIETTVSHKLIKVPIADYDETGFAVDVRTGRREVLASFEKMRPESPLSIMDDLVHSSLFVRWISITNSSLSNIASFSVNFRLIRSLWIERISSLEEGMWRLLPASVELLMSYSISNA